MMKKPLHLPLMAAKPTARTQPIAKGDGESGTEHLTTPDLARTLKVSVSYLAKARMRGDGPPYHKVGRSVRYVGSEVRQWLRLRGRTSTSEQ